MRRLTLFPILVVLAWTVAAPAAMAQFGKNKVTYQRFDWKIYESPHFDIHYYPEEEIFLEDVISYAESAYLKLSKEFDHEIRWRIPLIYYKTHAEFEQTNIQLSEIPESTLAFAEPLQNRMVFPVDVPPDFLFKLITHELTHIFEFSFFFEGNIGRVVRSRPPLWLMEGLASYMAQDESNMDRMVIRDAVVNNVLPPLQALDINPFFAYRYGHAVFDYIEQEHGKEGLRNFIFEYKKVLLTNNIGKAVEDAFGYDLDAFNRRFNRYLRKKYFPVLLEKKSPDDYGKAISLKRRRVFLLSPTLSPSGALIAALGTPKGELDLLILSAEDSSLVRNVTKGWTNKYQYLISETFEGKRDLSWSPTDDLVAVFARRENKRILLLYDPIKGDRKRVVDLGDVVQAASPCFSPDGRRIAFEGNRNGIVDIFEYDLDSGEIRNLTQDDQFDTNPWYAADGKSLLYNRRIGPYWKIFAVDLSDPSRKTQITFGPYSDLQPSYSRDGKSIYFTSDRNEYGVFNVYSLDVRTGALRQYTDVVAGVFAPQEAVNAEGEPELIVNAFFEGAFRLYRIPLRQPEKVLELSQAAPTAAEIEPFEPPIRLKADPDKKSDYKTRWDLDTPFVSVGVANDGTILTNSVIQFSDTLGDRRIQILASSVSDFSNTQVSYINMRRRLNWGAGLFDFRDFFLFAEAGRLIRDPVQRTTGLNFFLEYPFSRYYRVEGSAGLIDRSQDILVPVAVDQLGILRLSDRFATASVNFVGDTTRFMRFGPIQGKRFRVGAFWGPHLSGDFSGDILEYRLDFRAYRQVTRRSVLAWRLATIYNAGDRENFYPFGGLNQLRGFEFREFVGSRLAWTNLEFRFPLVDEMRFPILALRDIRGFFFLDVGAAWFRNDLFFDPKLRSIRFDPQTLEPIPFKFWDSENNRLQDGRGAYGFGFQFFFLGGLQFNWAWSKQLEYTQYVFDPQTFQLVPQKADTGGRRLDFYIAFDW